MKIFITCSILFLSIFQVACAPDSQTPTTSSSRYDSQIPIETSDDNEVLIRWTSHGIPHIQSNSWKGLGYGFAHAIATNTICVLAREFVTVRGKQAKYFGASEANVNADAFHRALLHSEKIDEYIS